MKSIPNGPTIPRSGIFSDIVVGEDCNTIALKVCGSISVCGNIFIDNCLMAKCFETVPGGARLENTTLSGLSLPLTGSSAANKDYVDSVAQGLLIKSPVKAASLTDLVLFGTPIIDGYQTQIGDRILIKNQLNGVENGIYEVSANFWSRTSDLPIGDNASRTSVFVENGTINNGSTFVCVNSVPNDIVGTDSLLFDLFNQNTQAGLGLYKLNNTLNVDVDNIGIEINFLNSLQIKNGGVTNSKLQYNYVNIIAGDGLQNGGLVMLGNSVSLDVDNTVIRTSGNQTINGILEIIGTLEATTLTDGIININSGNITGLVDLTLLGTLTADLITDGIATLSGGILNSLIFAGSQTFSDGILSINSGNITNAITINSNSFSDGIATLSSGTLSGLNYPIMGNDATNKNYVDGLIYQDKWKQPVRVATTANITLSGIQIIDGITISLNNRILVKNQSIASQNGIYIVSTGLWPRTSDMPNGYAASGSIVWIEEGTQNQSGWVVTNIQSSDIVGINNLTWSQWSGAGSIIAGAGLTKNVNTLSVNVDNVTLEIVLNNLQIKPLGVNTPQIASGAVTNAKLQNDYVNINTGDGLQNGGNVILGQSITIDVDNTVIRTFGNQSMSGVKTFTNSFQLQNASLNNITFTAPTVIDSNYTLTWPSNDGISGRFLTTDGNGGLSWTTAGVESSSIYFGYDSIGGIFVLNTFQILNINTNVINDSNYSNLNGTITINESGVYEISYLVQFESNGQTGGARATYSGEVQLNGVSVSGSRSSCFILEQSSSLISPSCGKTIFVQINSLDEITINFARTLGTTTGQTKPEQSSITIKKLR